MSTATLTRATADAAARPSLRAAIYLRISDDKAGRGLGVDRQREDSMRLLTRNGYTFVGEFSDNDISAWSGKRRPGYEALVEAVRRGEIDVIVAYRPDRLHRRTRELEDFIDLLDSTGTLVETVASGRRDLTTTSGKRDAKIAGAIAQAESEDIRDKVRRTMVQNAELGRPHGPLRTYGLSGVRVGNDHEWQVVEDEAAVIVEVCRRVLEGESLLAISRDLNARGIPSARGGLWMPTALRKLAMSARIAGWREHNPGRGKSEAAPFGGGEWIARAEWPAIVERETVERIRRRLGDPSRRRGPRSSYLLSGGLAVCAVCGENLAGRPGRTGREYRCNKASNTDKGCGTVNIKADAIEAFVVEAMREAHASGRFDEEVRDGAADSGAADVWALVESLRAKVTALGHDLDDDTISREEWSARRPALVARLASAEADLARRQESEASALLAGGLVEFDKAWSEDEAAGNLSRMRARLSAAITGITVDRALVRGRNTFDPDRVEIAWRA